MKQHLFFGFILLACALGAFVILNDYIYQEKQEPNYLPVGDVTLTGVVTEVSTEQMMVDGPAVVTIISPVGEMHDILLPSMGRGFCAAGDNVAEVSYIKEGSVIEVRGHLVDDGIVPCDSTTHYVRVFERVMSSQTGYEFRYRVAPAGYIPFSTEGMSIDPDFVSGIILMSEDESEELAATPDLAREYPPTMQVRVYQNTGDQSSRDWALSHPLESNIELAMSEPQVVMVGHSEALLYTSDGLYAASVYVVTNSDFVYVFTGAYIDSDSSIVKDFRDLIQSVVFVR
jgi:hypothetical protein